MKKITVLMFLLLACIGYGQDNTFPFLDTKAMGAYDFILKNPTFDGRGVVIFILDNSVDPDIPGLIKTSEDKFKVIDMQDFSNQVVLNMLKGKIDENNKSVIKDENDKIRISGIDKIALKPEDGQYFLSEMNEDKYFKNSPVPDLNDNGKRDDSFIFLSFKIKSDKVESK